MLRLNEGGLFSAGKSISSALAGLKYDLTGPGFAQDGANYSRKIMTFDVVTNPAADETIIVGAKTFTFKATAVSALQITIGALVTNGDFENLGAGWDTPTGWAYNATTNKGLKHTAGLTSTLNLSPVTQVWVPTPVVGRTYTVIWTMSERGAGTVTPSIGGVNGTVRNSNATFTETIVATTTDPLTFTPTYDFDGKIHTISVTDAVTDYKVETTQNIVDKINFYSGNTETAVTAYVLNNPLKVALIANVVGASPTFTVDEVKIVSDLTWSNTVTEAILENTDYWKVDPTTAKEAIPTVLVERNAGTWHNFLY
ncbi:MAG: hypothetical protein WC208_08285 [Gallionella sp.]|jgi:hypothetical protein